MEEINRKNNHKIGSITVIIGNMFSGKTGLLISKYNQNKNYRKCLAFKPTLDDRYSEVEIISHDKEIMVAGLTWDCIADKPFLSVAHLVATVEYPIRLFGKCDIENCPERSTK